MTKTASQIAHEWQWKGSWKEFKGKAKQMWGDLTEDDLDVAEGHYDEMFGRIQRSTGEKLEDIRKKFED